MIHSEILYEIIENPISGEWGKEGDGINVIRTANFTNEGYIDFTNVVKRNVDPAKITRKRLLNGDLIIEKSGGSPTQPVGRVVYFNQEGDFICNNFTSVLRAKSDVVYPKYLHYILFANHKYGLTNRFQNKTTGIINLQLKRYIKETKIPLPPLEEQKKIAAILDAADEYRQKTKALIDKYDQLTQSLFLDMFGDPLCNPKNLVAVRLESLIKDKSDLVDGPFGSSVNTKVDYIEEGEIPVIRTKNVLKNNKFSHHDLKFMTREKYETVKRSNVIPGDLILTKVGTIGNLCIFPKKYSEAVLSTTGSCRIRIDNSTIQKIYLLHYLNLYRPKMHEIASAGVQPFLNMRHIKNFDVLVPEKSQQNQFAERVAQIEEQKQQAEASLVKAEELFSSLLQRAFKGELTS